MSSSQGRLSPLHQLLVPWVTLAPGLKQSRGGFQLGVCKRLKGEEEGIETKRKRPRKAGPLPSGGADWAGCPDSPRLPASGTRLPLSQPPSEWASWEGAAPRPAPAPPGRRNPEPPCPGGWGTPRAALGSRGLARGALPPGPQRSRPFHGLTGAPGHPGKRCSIRPTASGHILSLMPKPDLRWWGKGRRRGGMGGRVPRKGAGKEPVGVGRRETLPRAPVTW